MLLFIAFIELCITSGLSAWAYFTHKKIAQSKTQMSKVDGGNGNIPSSSTLQQNKMKSSIKQKRILITILIIFAIFFFVIGTMNMYNVIYIFSLTGHII
ncbi:hypothetical protein DY052_05855 [Apilactobacillus timberlakei]|uniref:hypothetical protein n=1 Tax=Apilactobacillus timberlakei TaxID=2008380 RepID=UPI00112B3E33|nr:hypothetical protein [Apilactobacillus timberlakei]TPR14947.1 hypothetical protein DY052_05855 [Apilactobacillus timberlakei]